ncbi:MAG: phage holin family protein [Bacteroidota bacterium]|jgi:putative membrane protein
MKFLTKILISTLAILITAYILPGVSIANNNFLSALIVALVISFLNYFVKPILVILTIPVTFFTLGIFLLVINTIIILLADYMVDGFHVSGFWAAFWFSILLSLVNSIFEKIQQRTESN